MNFQAAKLQWPIRCKHCLVRPLAVADVGMVRRELFIASLNWILSEHCNCVFIFVQHYRFTACMQHVLYAALITSMHGCRIEPAEFKISIDTCIITSLADSGRDCMHLLC